MKSNQISMSAHKADDYHSLMQRLDMKEAVDRIDTCWFQGNEETTVYGKPNSKAEKWNQHGNISIEKHRFYSYLLYLPPNYSEEKKWPVVFFFHGIGERGSNPEDLLQRGMPQYLKEGLPLDAIMIAPQCPIESHWADTDKEVSEHLRYFISEMLKKYASDYSRVYATGLSMGGRCTWKTVLEIPEYFAAVAVVCGRTECYEMERICDIPVWMIHGVKDSVVSFANIQPILNALKTAKHPEYRLTVYPDADHDVWSRTYDNLEIYDWLLAHQKKGVDREIWR